MISLDKKYKDKYGPVRVLCIDKVGALPVVGVTDKGAVVIYTAAGQYSEHSPSKFDLIEVSPYEDIPIDAKCLFWDEEGDKFKGHFAGVNLKGKPKVWASGKTSWTVENCFSAFFNHCELAE